MSIKQRLKTAEKRAGIGTGATITVFRTFYEGEDSQTIAETGLAAISNRSRSITVCSIEGEDFSDFQDRVEQTCLEEFGNLPSDWRAVSE